MPLTETKIEQEVLNQGHFKIHNIGLFISRSVSNALIFAAIITVAFLIWGAINWIMSGGDKAKVEEARNRLTGALMGLAIVALVYLMWRLVLYFFGIGEVTNGQVNFTLF